jgi:Cell fusion glycoprotein K
MANSQHGSYENVARIRCAILCLGVAGAFLIVARIRCMFGPWIERAVGATEQHKGLRRI